MPAYDLAITSTRVATPHGVRPATVLVRGGVIAEVRDGAAGADARECFDAGDDALFPGLVDTHVHINDPGRADWEGFDSATGAAISGGVTTLVDMPLNSSPVTTSVRALSAKLAAASGLLRADCAFWGGVVPGNTGELAALRDAGCAGYKCFMIDSGIDDFPPVGEDDLRPAMRELARVGAPLLAHAEAPEAVRRAQAVWTDPRSHAQWAASRPPQSERDAVDLLVRLCRETGCPVHVVHVACAEAAEAIANAKAEGLPITAETCPHYLTFASEDIPGAAPRYKCAPPIRGRAQREALWDALRDGTLDLIASDHSPCPPALKHLDTGDVRAAWGGIASLGLTLAAVWTGASARGFDLDDLRRWLCAAPARLAGLGARKGTIAPGRDADLCVWSPDAELLVEPSVLRFRHKATPYEGMTLRGVVRRTYLRGSCVYEDGRIADEPRGSVLLHDAGA